MTVGAKIEGWSDSLRAELAPLGIGVTCIAPGPFRTDWAGRSLRQTPSKIADYADSAGKRHTGTRQSDGTQPGDPVRAGEAMVAIARNADAPRHLVLGALGYRRGTGRPAQARERDREPARIESLGRLRCLIDLWSRVVGKVAGGAFGSRGIRSYWSIICLEHEITDSPAPGLGLRRFASSEVSNAV